MCATGFASANRLRKVPASGTWESTEQCLPPCVYLIAKPLSRVLFLESTRLPAVLICAAVGTGLFSKGLSASAAGVHRARGGAVLGDVDDLVGNEAVCVGGRYTGIAVGNCRLLVIANEEGVFG